MIILDKQFVVIYPGNQTYLISYMTTYEILHYHICVKY